jgi:hypothetical protein
VLQITRQAALDPTSTPFRQWLKAFPDWIEHADDPIDGAESISTILPSASLKAIDFDVTKLEVQL